ncbi:MAG: GntR family transcriptional regulator [Spirochaetia bacterium]|nr:GntR family transcriptional regulator [Spirochaetia bacterium]
MRALTQDLFIANEIKALIEEKKFTVGDKIPSERVLCEMFNIQRLTVRGALSILENEGIISPKPKVGYYINKERVKRNVNSIESTIKIISDNSQETISLVKFEEIETDKYISRETQIPLGTRIFEVKILKKLENIPICVDYLYLKKEDFPSLNKFDFEKNNLYDILVTNYKIKPVSSVQKINVIQVEENYRSLLDLNNDDCVVLQAGSLYDKNNNFIAFIESYINYNYFEYVL